jgi:hypothetical protein
LLLQLQPLPWLLRWLRLRAWLLLLPMLRPLWPPLRLLLLLLVMLLKRSCLKLLSLQSLSQLLLYLLLRWLVVKLCLQSQLLRPLVWALLRFPGLLLWWVGEGNVGVWGRWDGDGGRGEG